MGGTSGVGGVLFQRWARWLAVFIGATLAADVFAFALRVCAASERIELSAIVVIDACWVGFLGWMLVVWLLL